MNEQTAATADAAKEDAAAGRSVRHAGVLMVQRGLHVAGAALFAVLVPRLMGPELFGQYALLTSVSFWFALLGGMGAVSMLTRAVPRLLGESDHTGVRRLVTSLLALRGLTGILTAASYAAVVLLAFRIGDWVPVLFIAAAIWTRTIGNLCFALFLGLNQAARWGAGDLLRRWLTLGFVLAGVQAGGLRGACAGFFAANVVVLALGLFLARGYIGRSDLDLSRGHLGPYLRIGTAYAAGNLLLSLTQRSGESLTRVATGDFTEVGYFGAAYSIYLTLGHALWQLSVSFAPYLVGELQRGRADLVATWLHHLAKWMLVAVVPIAPAVWLLGSRLVPAVLGEEYRPVTAALIPLAAALVTLALSCVGRLAALTLDRPGITASAAGIELVTFWVFGLLLARQWGSAGVGLAALAASAVHATTITWRVRPHLAYSLAGARRVLGAGLVFVPALAIDGGLPQRTAALAAACLAYLAVLWTLGIVTREEFWTLRRHLRRPSAA